MNPEPEIVPFHELPSDESIRPVNGMSITTPTGSKVELWDIDGTYDFYVRLFRPLEDGRQSLLSFGLSEAAALALVRLLLDRSQSRIKERSDQP